MQIDVSGDSIAGETPSSDKSAPNIGNNPTHAAILPNLSKVFVASAGSVVPGGVDVVSSFSPAFQSTTSNGLGAVTTISLPSQTASISAISESANVVTVTPNAALTNVVVGDVIVIAGVGVSGYNGTFTLTSVSPVQYVNTVTGLASSSGGTASVPPQPVFVTSTQSGAVYVANYNSNSVSAINTTLNVVSNGAPVGLNPVALAETPNGLKIYVANQGGNSVSSLNTADLSPNVVTGFTGTTPVWVVARADSQKVYVLTQGDGQLVTIDTATDTVTSSLPVGAGANFVFYDPHLNRLYVTNPNVVSASNPLGSAVYVFSDTGGANDTPLLLKAISLNPLSSACPSGCLPTSVTALPDGSRFYVASYQLATAPCPDTTITGSCVIPGVAVFDANSFALKTTMTLLTNPPFAVSSTGQYQFAVPPVSSCGPAPSVPPPAPALYAPASTRFRIFTTAAADSSHVYVSMCDAGAIAVINTTNDNANGSGGTGNPSDSVVTDLPAAFSAGAIQSNGEPPNQNPIFLLTGQ